MVKQERKRRVHRLGVDQVIIVEDQQYLFVVFCQDGQLIDQRRHQSVDALVKSIDRPGSKRKRALGVFQFGRNHIPSRLKDATRLMEDGPGS